MYGVIVLFLVVTIISSIIYLAPVDPARLTFGQRTDVESIEAKRKELGLDQPLHVQLFQYLKDISPVGIYKDRDSLIYDKTVYDTSLDTLQLIAGDTAGLNWGLRRLQVSLQKKDSLLVSIRESHSEIIDSAYLARYILNIKKPVKVKGVYVTNNEEKYNYKKLIPLGSKWLVVKAPYLRESFQSGRRVADILWEAIPKTAILALAAILIATFFGIIFGVVAALKRNTWIDNSAIVTSVLGYSLPSYVAAMIFAYVFGYLLADYTGLNAQGSLIVIDDLGNETFAWKNLILPAIALGIRPVAIVTQLTRSAMLDVLSQDYIRTAKAKGLSQNKVVFKHALRNALNPVVTAISGWFAALLAGAFFIENVFNYNGLGYETVQALLNFDLPVVLGAVIFAATIFVVINILIDIMYAVLDPRVTVGE